MASMQSRSPPREVRLDPLVLPSLDGLSDRLKTKLAAFDGRLHGWSPMTAEAFLQRHGVSDSGTDGLAASLRHLDHPNGLAYRAVARVRSESFTRSAWEQPALEALRCGGHADPSNLAAFIAHASEMKAIGAVRSTPSASARNRAGWRVRYPEPESVQTEVRLIQRWINDNLPNSALWTASIAMVSLATLHPLVDGNGRLSRMLFNLILHYGGLQRGAYVPVSEVFAASSGGKELREKHAYYRGDWGPFISYILDAAEATTAR